MMKRDDGSEELKQYCQASRKLATTSVTPSAHRSVVSAAVAAIPYSPRMNVVSEATRALCITNPSSDTIRLAGSPHAHLVSGGGARTVAPARSACQVRYQR